MDVNVPYVFNDDDREAVRRRHESLACVWDSGTFEVLKRAGVKRGWRCLEIGAGSGSVAKWLSHWVGDRGHVVATDRDIASLAGMSAANLEVAPLDVVNDDISWSGFDLVHGRMILEHVGLHIIQRLVSPLRLGGVLVLEELSALRTIGLISDRREQIAALVMQFMTRAGFDPLLGEKLAPCLVAAGLSEVAAEGRTHMTRGGSPEIEYMRTTFLALREMLVRYGGIAPQECDDALARLDDTSRFHLGPLMIAAWGRRAGK